MKAIAITHIGAEDVCRKEIKELIGADGKTSSGVVIFPIKSLKDLCVLCYRSQSSRRILYYLGDFEFKNLNDLRNKARNIFSKNEFLKWFREKRSFKVETKKDREDKLLREEICADLGEDVIESVKKDHKYTPKVSMKAPDTIIYTYVIKDRCHLGIDFSGFDMDKRNYRIFDSRFPVKGTLAYILLRIAGYKRSDILIDPLCKDGVIPIEGALYANDFPVNYFRKDEFIFNRYDELKKDEIKKAFESVEKKKADIIAHDPSLQHVKASRMNSKIAGVTEHISFSKVDLDFLETRLGKKKVDLVATRLPEPSKRKKLQEIKDAYHEFFYQCRQVMKPSAKICLINDENKPLIDKASNHGFFIVKKKSVFLGKKEFCVIILKSRQRYINR